MIDKKKFSSPFWKRLSLNNLVGALVMAGVFVMAVRYPASHDTWWHILSGQTMLETRGLLTVDPFSHTKLGQPWINHGWLGQLFWTLLLAIGGWTLVGLGLALIVTITFGMVWRQSQGNLYVKAFGIILGAIVSSIIWSARPQMLSFLFTGMASAWLVRFKAGQVKLLPWFPLLVVVWVNTHGGFAIAFILMIAYLVGELFNHWTAYFQTRRYMPASEETEPDVQVMPWETWRHLLLTFCLSFLAVLINPHTWHMWFYPFRTVGIGVLREFIAEWQSPNFHMPIIQTFLLMVLILIAAIARSNRRVDWTELALVGGWLMMSLLAVRNIPIFALVCTPILIKYVNLALEAQFGPLALGWPRPPSRPAALLNWLVLLLVMFGVATYTISTLSPQALQTAEEARFPAGAVRFIQANNPPGPMFNTYNLGGYLMYHLWPEYPVFVDGRTDLYDDKFLREYLIIAQALPGWQDKLAATAVNLVVTEAGSVLASALLSEPSWELVFESDQAAVFTKLE